MLQKGRPGWHQLSECITRERSEIKGKTVCELSRFSHVQLFVTLWTVAPQAPLSMGFPRQECWSGLPFPSPGNLSDSEIEPVSPAWAGSFFTS